MPHPRSSELMDTMNPDRRWGQGIARILLFLAAGLLAACGQGGQLVIDDDDDDITGDDDTGDDDTADDDTGDDDTADDDTGDDDTGDDDTASGSPWEGSYAGEAILFMEGPMGPVEVPGPVNLDVSEDGALTGEAHFELRMGPMQGLIEGQVDDDGTVSAEALFTTPNGQAVGPFDVEGNFDEDGFRLSWAGTFQGGPGGEITFECTANGAAI